LDTRSLRMSSPHLLVSEASDKSAVDQRIAETYPSAPPSGVAPQAPADRRLATADRVGEMVSDDMIGAQPRHPADTVSVLTYRTGVQDANLAGNVHGGWIMKLCDDVAVIAATRLAGGRVVTAAVDAMKFRSPVRVGEVITLRATVNAAWRTSMEVGVRVEAEHVPSGEVTHTCTAYLTMVALGEDERPVAVPTVEPQTPEDEWRHRAANHRRALRLAAPGHSPAGWPHSAHAARRPAAAARPRLHS
jgi:acyl-CoA hydrolase